MFAIYLLFLIPAFMFTWEGDLNGIGCSGWICMIIGFPGVVIALIIRGIKGGIDYRNKKAYDKKFSEESRVREDQDKQHLEKNETAQQEQLKKLRDIYQNSPITEEIKERILRNGMLPYLIEITNKGLMMKYENDSDNYIFRSNGLADLNRDEYVVLAEVLNDKLSNKYTCNENTKVHYFTYADGERGSWTEYTGVIMELKITRKF